MQASGRIVPIAINIADDSLLEQLLGETFNSHGFLVQFKELVDLSSLELIRPFIDESISLEVSHHHHTLC